jgi:hypothetical protein
VNTPSKSTTSISESQKRVEELQTRLDHLIEMAEEHTENRLWDILVSLRWGVAARQPGVLEMMKGYGDSLLVFLDGLKEPCGHA